MDRRAELSGREAGVWTEFLAALEGIPADRWETEGVLPGWSVKALARHVAGWLEECAGLLEQMREGTFSSPDDSPPVVDSKNAGFARQADEMSIEEVRAGLVTARELALARWGELTVIDDAAVEWFAGETYEHYEEHLPDLRGFDPA
jgi:hypothetical protein